MKDVMASVLIVSLYAGIPTQELSVQLDEVLGGRYRPSSMRTINRARDLYFEYAEEHGLPQLITTGSEKRGGYLVGYTLFLANKDYPSQTISNYTWGYRRWCELQRQTDPALGVSS